MAYIIKQIPEDFMVSEVIDLFIGEGGNYACYSLWKNNCTTERAVAMAAAALNKRLKHINYSGTKDKFAVTEQYISVLNGPKRNIEMNNVKLNYLGRIDERINLSTHVANDFDIVVRNIEKAPEKLSWVPNYFDEQRFGMEKTNHYIGKLIVQKKFKEAVRMIPEDSCIEHLKKYPNDAIGALRTIPKRTLWMYLHAYQSFIWNKAVSEYLKQFDHKKIKYVLGELVVPKNPENIENIDVPMVGYETTIPKKIEPIINKILSDEGVKMEDFKIPEMPEMVSKGSSRKILAPIEDLEISELENDELNNGKKRCSISFRLPRGSYGTMAIRCMFD